MQVIKPATLQWRDGIPFSASFDDIYFSRDDGLAETRYVFIEANDLPSRFTQSQKISIGETGFGTGLNFLATLNVWHKTAAAGARLNYVAVEKHPLRLADLERTLSVWPELQHFSEQLLAAYPPLVNGAHRLRLSGGRVSLTLLFGDALDMLTQYDAQIDAWYLDGFAPGKNTDMWSDALLTQIARLSRKDTSFATFTAAGDVRRRLQQAGFRVEKRPGYGRKREMLCGCYQGAETEQLSDAPWFTLPRSPRALERKAIVIGAGLSGVTIAHSLARRGWQIQLLEREAQPAQQASGNLTGVVIPRLTVDMNHDAAFYLSAFLYSVTWLNQLKACHPTLSWQQSGVLQFVDARRLEQLSELELPQDIAQCVDARKSTELSGITINESALYFPTAGWLNPPQLCQLLLQDQADRIELLATSSVQSLRHEEGQWQVAIKGRKSVAAPVVIVANAQHAAKLLNIEHLNMQAVRGQLSYVEAIDTLPIKLPLCYEGYVIPTYQGQHCVGATYDWQNDSAALSDQDHQRNLNALQQRFPAVKNLQLSGGRVAFRASSADHLPLIGPVPDWGAYQQTYADLHHGRPTAHYPAASYQPGLYLSVGHGSRGLVSCPFAAELLAAQLEGEPLPVVRQIANKLHPGRFVIRKLKRSR